MVLALLSVAVSGVGLALFARLRSRFRPRLAVDAVSHDRAGAVQAAASHVRTLTGIDVSRWQSFAVPCSDQALLQQAHQLGLTDEVAPHLLRWGLLYGWRVRFCGPKDTLVVGLGGNGRVNFLNMAGRRLSTVTSVGHPTPPADLPPAVLPDLLPYMAVGARRAPLRRADPGPENDGSSEGVSTFVAEDGPVRVSVRVESWTDRVVDVATRAELTVEGVGALRRADRRWRSVQRAGMTGMVLSLVAGGLALAVARQAPPLLWPAVLGMIAFASVMAGEPQMFPRTVVEEFDGRVPLVECRRRHRRHTMVAGAVNGAFVASGTAVGQGLLIAAGAPGSLPIPTQLAVGAVVGCAWLGLTTSAFSVLAARGRLAATAELAPEDLGRLGYSWREVISASLQSSVGEEVLYRLLIVSLAWHLSDQPLIGVVVASMLWSATHDAGEIRPRVARSLELLVVGCALGVLFVRAGLAAAVVAHLTFNLLLLGWPLLAAAGRRVRPVPA